MLSIVPFPLPSEVIGLAFLAPMLALGLVVALGSFHPRAGAYADKVLVRVIEMIKAWRDR